MSNAIVPHQVYYSAPSTSVQPYQPKQGGLWEWYQNLKTQMTPAPQQPGPISAIARTTKNFGVGGGVSAILGVLEGEFDSLDIAGKYPVDAIASAVLAGISIYDSTGISDAAGQSCFDSYVKRKAKEWRQNSKNQNPNSKNKNSTSSTTSNSNDKKSSAAAGYDDPVLAKANALGL